MNPVSPRNDLARALLLILITSLLIAGSLWVLRPFLVALVWATTVVVATWPILLSVQRRLWGRRSLAVLVMMLIMLVLLVLPIVAGISIVAEHADAIAGWAKALPAYTLPAPPAWVGQLPLIGNAVGSEWQRLSDAGSGGVLARLQPYAMLIANQGLAAAGSAGMLVVHLLLTLAVSAILYARGEAAACGLRRFARRLAGSRGENALLLAGMAIRAVALGIVVTALTQSALGGLGVWIAGVPFAGLLTVLMLLLCIAQIGPTLPLLGAVAWLYWQNEPVWATSLLVWTGIVGTLDNVLRPILIRRGADLPLLLILVGVIGGLLAFGIVGLFVGPVILAVSYTLLKAWIDEGLVSPVVTPDSVPPPADSHSPHSQE